MRVEGSVALVTGGASGLGRATAAELVSAGAAVVIADLPGSPGADVAGGLGDRAVFHPTDVTDPAQVQSALDVARELGTLRIAVSCAGLGPAAKVLSRHGPMPLEDFAKVVTVNLIGTFNLVRLAAARIAAAELTDGERGVLVNTASVAAYDGQIGQAAYAASKGGVVSMTLPIARELARHAIRVMAIAPGLFDTPMLAGLPHEARASLGQQVPHPARLGKPSEYAALVRHIIENPMLNGEVVRLDGAVRMAPR
jgi:NAD(P)-dependent dehydrogenase (short-subunit alcohol dehydrogenase family)